MWELCLNHYSHSSIRTLAPHPWLYTAFPLAHDTVHDEGKCFMSWLRHLSCLPEPSLLPDNELLPYTIPFCLFVLIN